MSFYRASTASMSLSVVDLGPQMVFSHINSSVKDPHQSIQSSLLSINTQLVKIHSKTVHIMECSHTRSKFQKFPVSINQRLPIKPSRTL